jgi:uncharacterized protein (TIGR04222 family)
VNPFNLAGPEFLLFYLIFSVTVLTGACIYWHVRTSRADVPVLTNPYEIAYLRDGPSEAIRVAVIGLIERGVLTADELRVVRTVEGREAGLIDRFERKIAEYFSTRGAADTAAKSDALQALLQPIKERLERDGLILNEELSAIRTWLTAGVLSSLWIVSLTKIAIALDRGKSNVLFLVIFTVVAAFISIQLFFRKERTAAGDAALERLRELHRTELNLNLTGNEMLLYAAVFGAAAAPVAANPYHRPPEAGGGSGCGTSGGGCGSGGGGGGGCGGCGGGGD